MAGIRSIKRKFITSIAALAIVCTVHNTLAQNGTETIEIDGHTAYRINAAMLYSEAASDQRSIRPAVVPIEQQDLILEFDDLWEDRENYYVRIAHLNSDWTASGLRDLDFIQEYNEFIIEEYLYSSNTHIPYVHYTFRVPALRLPGNYQLIVYRDGNKDEVVLRKRFMVVAQEVELASLNRPGQSALRRDMQEISFTVRYDPQNIPDAAQSIHVVVRQNDRWDNAIFGLQPSRLDASRGVLEYLYFDGRSSFPGGSEYRFVDFTSLNYPGMNTAGLDRKSKPNHLLVAVDKPRSQEAYTQYGDANGHYEIQNRDVGGGINTGQYLWVHFRLEAPPTKELEKGIFVGGSWSGYETTPAYRLHPEGPGGAAVVLMKQGLYDYQYFTASGAGPSGKLNPIEGDHVETENVYDILVYQRSFFNRADRLIGYLQVRLNRR